MDNYVSEPVCRERSRVQEEHLKRVDERLKIGEGKIDNVEKAVVLLTEMAKQSREELADHDRRLETLEHRPNMWMDKIVAGIIAAIISGVIALLFNLF